jgi:hypothetical protein
MTRNIETFRTDWNGITVEIRYEPKWLNIETSVDPAHIEVESIDPPRAALPITETGYLSHFPSRETIAAYGGAVAYVEAWLETDSQAPEWSHIRRRQLNLF